MQIATRNQIRMFRAVTTPTSTVERRRFVRITKNTVADKSEAILAAYREVAPLATDELVSVRIHF